MLLHKCVIHSIYIDAQGVFHLKRDPFCRCSFERHCSNHIVWPFQNQNRDVGILHQFFSVLKKRFSYVFVCVYLTVFFIMKTATKDENFVVVFFDRKELRIQLYYGMSHIRVVDIYSRRTQKARPLIHVSNKRIRRRRRRKL